MKQLKDLILRSTSAPCVLRLPGFWPWGRKPTRPMRRFILPFILTLVLVAQAQRGPLLIAPYLQVGPRPSPQTMEIWWGARPGVYQLKYRSGTEEWRLAPAPIAQGQLFHTSLTGLKETFEYQLVLDGKSIFSAKARTLKPPGADCRFTIVGDTACGTDWEKQTAYQMSVQKTDCTVILGDIVYNAGRQSEYLRYFFPVYNSSQAGASTGAPLLRSVPFLAAPGNHDVNPPSEREPYTDGYAYFLFWSQPLNGPDTDRPVYQPASNRAAFAKLAGPRYPRMGSFSVDVGDVHWTLIDSNPENDWSRPALRQWLKDDLKAAQKAKWRFVGFHHSPFSSGEHHFREQHMRLLAPVFEQGKVDIVFAGHMHNYQRTRPLTFANPRPLSDGTVSGQFALDKGFDGVKSTRPRGVIYLVDGGGGAYLHDSEGQPVLQPYTVKMESHEHSFTVCDVTPTRVTMRQLTSLGREIDRFVVER